MDQVRRGRSELNGRLCALSRIRATVDADVLQPPNGEMEAALLRALDAMRNIERARDLVLASPPPVPEPTQPTPPEPAPAPIETRQESPPEQPDPSPPINPTGIDLPQDLARTQHQLDQALQRLEQLAPPPQHESIEPPELMAADLRLAQRRMSALEQTRQMLERELQDEQRHSRLISKRTSSLEQMLNQQQQQMDQLLAEKEAWEQQAPSPEEDLALTEALRAEIEALKLERGSGAEAHRQKIEKKLQDTIDGRNQLEQALATSKETLMRVLRAKIDLEFNFSSLREQTRAMESQTDELELLRHEKGKSELEIASLKHWLETTIQRRDSLSEELQNARTEVNDRLDTFHSATSELESLRTSLDSERQEKHETIERLVILERRLEKKYPMAGRKILKTFENGNREVAEALATHFDYLFNFRHGYPFLDFNNLRSLTRKFISSLRSDPGSALDLRYYSSNRYLKEHSFNVARLAIYLGMHKGYRDSALEILGLCGLLQDIGMLTVPDAVFRKGGKLEKQELLQIRRHPVQSVHLFEEMAAEGDFVGDLVSTVLREHHEREDGGGYPHGKTANEIHDFSKVLLIADSYAAMTAPRVYRKSQLPHDVMTRLIHGAQQGKFNRDLVQVFVRAMSLYPIGSFVELASGETAKVVASDPQSPKRPVVKLISDSKGAPLTQPVYLNLRQEEGLEVIRAVREE